MRDYIVPAAFTSLPEAANMAMSVVLGAMRSVCTLNDVDFRDILKTHETSQVRYWREHLILS